MVTISQTFSELKKKKPLLNAGGVLLLNNYLAIAKPEILGKIKGEKAIVEAKEMKNGYLYLFIKLPLNDDSFEELRVLEESEIEEGDEVWISSIIAILLTNNKGEIVVRYDAIYINDVESLVENDVKSLMIYRCANIMMNSAESSKISIDITYEGNALPITEDKMLIGNNNIILYNGDFYSDIWTISKLNGYTNAIRLSHGLIVAERPKHEFVVLNADGTILCDYVQKIDYGLDYLIVNGRLWWFDSHKNLWEELSTHDVFSNYTHYMATRHKSIDEISLRKIKLENSVFYIYKCSISLEVTYDERGLEWDVEEFHLMGLLDAKGIWKLKPNESIINLNSCCSIIIVQEKGKIKLYDSERTSYKDGCLKEIIDADDYSISNQSTIILKKDGKQGLFDAISKSLIIPCCIDNKYTVLPYSLGEGLLGVYSEEQEKTRHSTKKTRKYYFLDYSGDIKLAIKPGYGISSKFNEGKSIISMTDWYHGDFYQETIDLDGNTISKHSESFPGTKDDYFEEDMRNIDRDNWDAMTDGMYGDYPDEGYDGDYDFMG